MKNFQNCTRSYESFPNICCQRREWRNHSRQILWSWTGEVCLNHINNSHQNSHDFQGFLLIISHKSIRKWISLLRTRSVVALTIDSEIDIQCINLNISRNGMSSFTTLLPTPMTLSGDWQLVLPENSWPAKVCKTIEGDNTVSKRPPSTNFPAQSSGQKFPNGRSKIVPMSVPQKFRKNKKNEN